MPEGTLLLVKFYRKGILVDAMVTGPDGSVSFDTITSDSVAVEVLR